MSGIRSKLLLECHGGSDSDLLAFGVDFINLAHEHRLMVNMKIVGITTRTVNDAEQMSMESPKRGRPKGTKVDEETRRAMADAQQRRYDPNTVEGVKARRATSRAVKLGLQRKQQTALQTG